MIRELTLENINIIKDSILSTETVEKEFSNNPFSKYLVYIENNKVIAYLYYSDIYERIEINQIEVESFHRNCGIGTKLMKKLTDNVEKSVTLEVKKDNIAAIKLYHNFGFEDKAIRKGYYKGIDGILMERKH